MEKDNPFVWILGFVLVFWIIGGNGFGGSRGNVASDVVAVESINQNAFWRDNFNAIAALGKQANDNTSALAQLTINQSNGISKQISDCETQQLRDRLSESQAKVLQLENRVYFDAQFCDIRNQLVKKPNVPPFFIDGNFDTRNDCRTVC